MLSHLSTLLPACAAGKLSCSWKCSQVTHYQEANVSQRRQLFYKKLQEEIKAPTLPWQNSSHTNPSTWKSYWD